jgi:TRAP-type C4-dicarboxylate transport system substrate-binding protein
MVEKKDLQYYLVDWQGARSVNNSVRPKHKPDDLKGMKLE